METNDVIQTLSQYQFGDRMTFVIKNINKKKPKKVILFGAVFDLTDERKDEDIIIELFESSHLKVKTDLLSKTIKFKGLRYKTDNQKNFCNGWNIIYPTPVGGLGQTTWMPINYLSVHNKDFEIFAPIFKLKVDEDLYIHFEMAACSTLSLEFMYDTNNNQRNIDQENFFNKYFKK